MLLPHGTFVAVVDGHSMELFRNGGNEAFPALMEMPRPDIDAHNKQFAVSFSSSSGNHADTLVEEAGFAAAAVDYLNHKVLDHKISNLVIIAPPRTLGEMRRHYHKELKGKLIGELAKELVGSKGPRIIEALRAQ